MKTQWITTSLLLIWLYFFKWHVICVEKDVEKLVGMQNGTDAIENSLAFPQNVKHRVTIWSSDSTPGYISKRNENMCSQKLVHICIQQHYS